MEQILVKNIISQETPAIDIRSKAPTVDLALGASSAVAALTAASAAGGPVLIPAGTYLIDQDVTCTAPLVFAGGKFSIASGKTLTINGPIQAPLAQIFEGLGTVAFGQGAIPEVYPQWWGAKGDGVQDDAPALRKAMATGRDVYLIGGTYLMDSVDAAFNYDGNAWVLKFTNSNQKLSGGPRATIKFGAGMIDEGGQAWGAGLMLVLSVTDIEISGILFDMNGANNLVGAVGIRNCIALKVVDSNRVKIKDNHFYNSPGHNAIVTHRSSYQIQIESNIFTNGGTSIPGNTNQYDWSAIYCESDETVISNNIITHNAVPFAPAGGIEFHGSRMVGKGNIIKNSFPGIYIGGFGTGGFGTRDISDLNISDNVMQDCRAGIMFSGRMIRRCNIIGNTIHLNRDQFTAYTVDQYCVGIWQYHDGMNVYATHFGSLIDCNISNNTIVQTDTPSADQNGNGMLFATVDGLMVSNNIIRNVAATGVVFRGTPWGTKNVQFIGNSIHDFGQNTIPYAHYAMQLSFGMTFTAPPDAGDTVSNVWNMLIEGNSFSKTTGIAEDRAFWTMWNAASIVDGLVIRQNKYSNIGKLLETAGGYVPSLGLTAQGSFALTDFNDANYEKAINTSNLVNLGAYGGYIDETGLPNTPEGKAQAMSDAMDWYASTGFTGRWNVTSLLPTAPRYVLVSIKTTVPTGSKADIIAGPVAAYAEWTAPPYKWYVTFVQAASAVRVGIIGQIVDTRLVIVPVQKIGSSLFIHLSYFGSLTGVSGTIRIVGVFA